MPCGWKPQFAMLYFCAALRAGTLIDYRRLLSQAFTGRTCQFNSAGDHFRQGACGAMIFRRQKKNVDDARHQPRQSWQQLRKRNVVVLEAYWENYLWLGRARPNGAAYG